MMILAMLISYRKIREKRMAPNCSVKLSNCVVMYDIVRYFMALSYSDTVVVTLSDWRDTGAGTTENMKMYILSKLPLLSCKSFWRRKKTDDLKWLQIIAFFNSWFQCWRTVLNAVSQIEESIMEINICCQYICCSGAACYLSVMPSGGDITQ